MEDIEGAAMIYALGVKGGYYDRNGQITELLTDAKFFSTQQEAIKFRQIHDSRHYVDCSTLLRLTVFISELEE